MRCLVLSLAVGGVLVGLGNVVAADRLPEPPKTAAERGYHNLVAKPYLPADFDDKVFDALWTQWEEPLRRQAERAAPADRRRMALARYGLLPAPDGAAQTALQYASDGRGGWVMNCLACHGGKVAGQAVSGLPNSLFAMQTLAEEVRAVKREQGKLRAEDVAAAWFPLGGSNGTTNAVMFGVALGALRDRDLNVVWPDAPPAFIHHDMDAPPWWNVRKKSHLYADGFAPKGHRALMQFLMVPENGPENFRKWESEFEDLLAWIESLEPPKYPWAVDPDLAGQGRKVFNRACAECHGTYGDDEAYPNRVIDIEVVGTDPVRLGALSTRQRLDYERGWFGHYGEKKVVAEPSGYVAPPLDGVWASAPYLHNGSVPTLWHLFHPERRPVVWRRSEDGYDQERIGLEVAEFDELPADAVDPRDKRRYFDTRLRGKSAAGHSFPADLNPGEQRTVLEYLKTL